MALSFADWERQLAEGSIAGGVLGTPTSGPGAISMDVASSPLYAQSVMDLLTKMQGSNTQLQGFYSKGLTPQQVLFGQTGTAPGQHLDPTGDGTNMITDRPSNDVSMPFYNTGPLKDPSAMFYDPAQGVISPEANIKEGTFDKVSQFGINYILPILLSMGMGGAIAAVGGAGGMFGASNLIGGVPRAGQTVGNLTGGTDAPGGGAAPSTASPNSMGNNPLLAILALLSRFGKGS
jgi:hypothetical protein